MTLRRWNLLTAVSLAAIVAEFLLVRSGFFRGRAVIVLGCAALVGSLPSSSRRSASPPAAAPWPPPWTRQANKGKSLVSSI